MRRRELGLRPPQVSQTCQRSEVAAYGHNADLMPTRDAPPQWPRFKPLVFRGSPSVPLVVGRQVDAGPSQRAGTVLRAHGIDGRVAGEVCRALLKLQLAALAGEAA